MINLFQPSVGAAELAEIDAAFSANWLGTGSRVARFEARFAAFIGGQASATIAVTSCTEGLFQALPALHLGPGDDVILPSVSFVGAAHAVRSCGARVVLCDVDPVTLNPTVEQVANSLTPSTRAILMLHYGGDPGQISAIAELARQRELLLIEDAACGLGALDGDRACGTIGDVGVWSFDSMKSMTTGDGGMIWCRDPEVAQRIRNSVRLGGATTGLERVAEGPRWWESEPAGIGRRAAMNDVAAAIGLVQLDRLPEFLARRRDVAEHYAQAIEHLSWLRLAGPRPAGAPTFAWVQTAVGIRDQLARYLVDRDIYTSFRYWPLHRMRLYATTGEFPGADHAADTTLMLPLHSGLTDGDVERVVDAVMSFDPSAGFSR